MDGLFLVALVMLCASAIFIAGFCITIGLVLVTKGPDAARQFFEEEW